MKNKITILFSLLSILILFTPAFADFNCTLTNNTMVCPTPAVTCGAQSQAACQWERDWYKTQFEACVNETASQQYDFSACDGVSAIDVRTESMQEDMTSLKSIFLNSTDNVKQTITNVLAIQNANSMNCEGKRITCTQYAQTMSNRNLTIIGAFIAGLAMMYLYYEKFKRSEIKEDEISRELPRF